MKFQKWNLGRNHVIEKRIQSGLTAMSGTAKSWQSPSGCVLQEDTREIPMAQSRGGEARGQSLCGAGVVKENTRRNLVARGSSVG